jgi:hypothetical protein
MILNSGYAFKRELKHAQKALINLQQQRLSSASSSDNIQSIAAKENELKRDIMIFEFAYQRWLEHEPVVLLVP